MAGYDFPDGVEYEILEKLFIPDDYSNATGSPNGRSAPYPEELVDRLVHEAMELTNNLAEETTDPRGRLCLFGSCKPKWRPAGRIMVWDDRIGQTTTTRVTGYRTERTYDYSTCHRGEYYHCPRTIVNRIPIEETRTVNGRYVPVYDLEVRARRWFTTHTGYTNTYGYYSCDGQFKNPANYSIRWEKYHFSIRKGIFQQSYNGPKKTGDWDLNIKEGLSKRYAIIFQAARDYYYGDILGLKRPPQNSSWKPQMKIRYEDEQKKLGLSCLLGFHAKNRRSIGRLFLGNWLRIYKVYPRCRPADEESQWLYGVVIHELAHASHWELRKNNWNDNHTEARLKEGWATGVETLLSRQRYPTYDRNYDPTNYTRCMTNYIEISLELVETANFSIAELENVMGSVSNFQDWKNAINTRYKRNETLVNNIFDSYDDC